MTSPSQPSIFCSRCSRELTPAAGTLYEIRVEAVADPSPPDLALESPEKIRQQIEQILQRLEVISEREALDQVVRRLIFYLCTECYHEWIENPAG